MPKTRTRKGTLAMATRVAESLEGMLVNRLDDWEVSAPMVQRKSAFVDLHVVVEGERFYIRVIPA